MKQIILILSILITYSVSGQTSQSVRLDSTAIFILAGNVWENHDRKQEQTDPFYSIIYYTNGTFIYNQRPKRSYWKIIDKKYIQHSVDSLFKNTDTSSPIFDGKYTISELSDSTLTLKREGEKRNDKFTPFFLKKMKCVDYANEEPMRTVEEMVLKEDTYKKISYKWGGVFYFRNDVSVTVDTYEEAKKNFLKK